MTVAPLTSCTYVYIHVSYVYKLACTLHRTINLLPLVCCTPTSDSRYSNRLLLQLLLAVHQTLALHLIVMIMILLI
jgi:hypothetical protein